MIVELDSIQCSVHNWENIVDCPPKKIVVLIYIPNPNLPRENNAGPIRQTLLCVQDKTKAEYSSPLNSFLVMALLPSWVGFVWRQTLCHDHFFKSFSFAELSAHYLAVTFRNRQAYRR
jgi:hypothetical protein